MPSGKSAQPLITDNLDGTVTVQYSPTEAGLHEMHIKYNGTHIPGQCTHTQKKYCVLLRGVGLMIACYDTHTCQDEPWRHLCLIKTLDVCVCDYHV